MAVRNYTVQVFEDATGKVMYRHTFPVLEDALTAIRELHRDYAGVEYRVSFTSM